MSEIYSLVIYHIKPDVIPVEIGNYQLWVWVQVRVTFLQDFTKCSSNIGLTKENLISSCLVETSYVFFCKHEGFF